MGGTGKECNAPEGSRKKKSRRRLTSSVRIYEMFTLSKTNIAPENRPSHKESSLPTIHFQGRTVSFREGIFL